MKSKSIVTRNFYRDYEFHDKVGVCWKIRPFSEIDFNNSKLINKLIKWRNKNRQYFFEDGKVTYKSTQDYLLNGAIQDSSRILFLIANSDNEIYGHFGFKNISFHNAELDNVIKGNSECPSMKMSLRIVIYQIFTSSTIKTISLEVKSSNFRAIELYSSSGFKVNYQNNSKLNMKLDREEFLHIFDNIFTL